MFTALVFIPYLFRPLDKYIMLFLLQKKPCRRIVKSMFKVFELSINSFLPLWAASCFPPSRPVQDYFSSCFAAGLLPEALLVCRRRGGGLGASPSGALRGNAHVGMPTRNPSLWEWGVGSWELGF